MKSILKYVNRIHTKITKSIPSLYVLPGKQATSEIESLTSELATYKHAYATTLTDRDRLTQELKTLIETLTSELATYKHAYTTTMADRDRLAQRLKALTELNHKILAKSAPSTSFIPGKLPTPKKPGLPNVLCVGVQKSATSFLYSILREHPLVASFPKDEGIMTRLHLSGSITELLEISSNMDVQRPVMALFDVDFIHYAHKGAETIKNMLCEKPRILICLRDPVQRVLSEYRMRIRSIHKEPKVFLENFDFWDAIDMEPIRSAKNEIYRNYYAYTDRSVYADRISDYINEFGRENIHIIVTESDFGSNTSDTIADLFNFLSIHDADAFMLTQLNHHQFWDLSRVPTKVNLVCYLANGMEIRNPQDLDDYKDNEIVRLKITSDVSSQLDIDCNNPCKELLDSALQLQRRLTYNPGMNEQRDLFEKYFKKDVFNLEKIIGRDLSVWYKKYELTKA